MKRRILALLGGTLLSASAMAGGYQVNLASQRQVGMGHTGTGIQTGTASIFFNPGAMSFMRENGVTIGASLINSRIAYRAPEPTNTTALADNDFGTPFQVYGVFGINEKIKVGLGIYTPFGSGVRWGEEWNGKYGLNEIDLKAVYFQPTVSYQITDQLGIGVGFVVATGGVNLQRVLPVQGQDGQEGSIELDGGAETAYGFNAGVYFEPTEQLSIGINYRSKVDIKVNDGSVTFRNIPASAMGNFPDGTEFSASLPMPSTLSLGVGFKPTDQLTLAVDVSRVQWSAYENLRFDFTQPVAGSTVSESDRKYEDAMIYRIGGEYQLNEALALRAGAYYDQTPVQDGYLTPETPDSDSRGLSVGVGYKVSDNFSLDASFLYINKAKRTDAADKSRGIAGTYKSIAYIPGLAVNFQF
ncbi:outer membrane protein transport protein [Pontibacter sp. E15-1]|uniref:OmpP1/FadL family transporter n=1 Tax=Pontibacter sp. E15-1 TaxID=2919918 RepID=UPI001F4FA76B|nr:outer membrane protein transport protein [Pontibacter sp. E15-1]MCJ8167176.1 outer membrane protein transport protein [Pontibacter sp. E15-1]